MTGNPWVRRFVRDALHEMRPLGLELRGALVTLSDLQADRGGPLPDDDRLLAGYCGVSPRKWRSLRDELIAADVLEATAAGLSVPRLAAELSWAAARIEKATTAGRVGGQKRAENSKKSDRKNHELGNLSNKNSESDQATLKLIQNLEPPSEAARVRTREGGYASPRSSRRSEGFRTSLAPSRSRAFGPSLRGSSGPPGQAQTSLPRSAARRAGAHR